MERVMWKPIKRMFCEKAGEEVALEGKYVFPAGFLADQPPRIVAHRCSLGFACNRLEGSSCQWAGTLPGYDPFSLA